MRFIQRVFDFYIFSNMHVALATFSLTKITLVTFGNTSNEAATFVFFATIVGYNFIRFYRKPNITLWFSEWMDANKKGIALLAILSVVGMAITAISLRKEALITLVPFGLFTIFYVVPFSHFTRSDKSLRTLSGIKIFLIAFSWAGATVLFPLVDYNMPVTTDALVLFLQRFLIVLVITIPFDIRDLNYDVDSLKTLPQVLGVQRVKKLGLFLLMLFLGLNFLKQGVDQVQIRIELMIAVISLLFLIKSEVKQHNYYSAFYVESIPIVWWLLIWYNY